MQKDEKLLKNTENKEEKKRIKTNKALVYAGVLGFLFFGTINGFVAGVSGAFVAIVFILIVMSMVDST